MIAANELRIGNLVKWIGPHHIENAKISAISKEEVGFVCGDYGMINELAPVELSPEILEKCGFSKDIDDLVLDINHGLFVSYNDDDFVHFKSNNLETIISIQYLHQLQNLYYALCGEELNYQP